MASDVVEGLKLQLVHGFKKYNLSVELGQDEAGNVLTVGHLSALVADITQIPAENQKLIFKGCSLKNPEASLAELGMKQGSKVMLLGKRPEPEDSEDVMKMESAERDLEKSQERLSEIASRLDGINKGFLDDDKKDSMLKDLNKQLLVLSEGFMKLLESLDALRFEEDNKGARTRRKNLVDKIQGMLDQSESLVQNVKDTLARNNL